MPCLRCKDSQVLSPSLLHIFFFYRICVLLCILGNDSGVFFRLFLLRYLYFITCEMPRLVGKDSVVFSRCCFRDSIPLLSEMLYHLGNDCRVIFRFFIICEMTCIWKFSEEVCCCLLHFSLLSMN